jgi:hypothetical protein
VLPLTVATLLWLPLAWLSLVPHLLWGPDAHLCDCYAICP